MFLHVFRSARASFGGAACQKHFSSSVFSSGGGYVKYLVGIAAAGGATWYYYLTHTPSGQEEDADYGRTLYEKKFSKYGYGEEVPKDDLYVHSRTIAHTEERNTSSREAHRVYAKDPKTLPTYSLEEFKEMASQDGKIIASFRGGVYDLTPFVNAHPGGDRISMAMGLDLEPFWEVYKLHFRPHIQHLLEDFRIGNLSAADAEKIREETVFPNMYTDEPERPRSVLRFASERPANVGPRLHELTRLALSFPLPCTTQIGKHILGYLGLSTRQLEY